MLELTKISADQMDRIARLAKLSLSEQEKSELGGDLERIISFADMLSQVDTEGVPITTHAVQMQNVFRQDVRAESFDRAKLLKNSPDQDGACFIVPKVVE